MAGVSGTPFPPLTALRHLNTWILRMKCCLICSLNSLQKMNPRSPQYLFPVQFFSTWWKSSLLIHPDSQFPLSTYPTYRWHWKKPYSKLLRTGRSLFCCIPFSSKINRKANSAFPSFLSFALFSKYFILFVALLWILYSLPTSPKAHAKKWGQVLQQEPNPVLYEEEDITSPVLSKNLLNTAE